MNFSLRVADQQVNGVLVETHEDMQRLLRALRMTRVHVLDLETTGLCWWLGDRIAGIALYLPDEQQAYYVAFRHGEGANWQLDHMDPLRDVLFRPDTICIGWNFKFDMGMFGNEGFHVDDSRLCEDVMIALHLLDENRAKKHLNYRLKDCSRQFIDPGAADAEEALKDALALRGLKKENMALLPASMVAEYAMMDVVLTWRMREFLLPYLHKWHVADLYTELCQFMQGVVHPMQQTGMLVDRRLIQQHIGEMEIQARDKLAEIQHLAGFPINPNSPQQVAQWLEIRDAQKTTLNELKDPRAELILEYKHLTKGVGTFYQPYLAYSAGDGRIHANFNIRGEEAGGTNSGRLSSSEPNLQQVPRKSKVYRVKDVFVAPPGYKIAQLDYANLELRLAAHFTGQPIMREMFNKGGDLHKYTASHFFRVPVEQVTKEQRHIGKTGNFGFLYGMGAGKAHIYLNNNGVKCDQRRAAEILSSWHALYPEFRARLNRNMRIAESWRTPDGERAQPRDPNAFQYYRLAIDGRVRHYNGEWYARPFTAFNFEIQGTGAVLMRRAMMQVAKLYDYRDGLVIPVATVHDSGIWYVREDVLDEALLDLKAAMEDFPQFNPAIRADIQIGDSWGTVEDYTPCLQKQIINVA